MVLAHGDVDGRCIATWDQKVTSSFIAVVVVEHFLCATTENYHVFTGLRMPMNGNDRSGLDGVQHPLGAVVCGVPEVEVLA